MALRLFQRSAPVATSVCDGSQVPVSLAVAMVSRWIDKNMSHRQEAIDGKSPERRKARPPQETARLLKI